jgi:site-specific recombinase XerD
MSNRGARSAITRTAARAGIVGTISSHQLRKTFATHVYETTGNNLRLVQQLLGHSDPKVTAHYIEARQSDQAAAVDFERVTA